MNIKLLVIGKTNDSSLIKGIEEYTKRLTRYVNFKIEVIADVKNAKALSTNQLKEMEGEMIVGKLASSDYVVLLDENGDELTSVAFAKFIEKTALNSTKNLVFIVGGAYGFSEKAYSRANKKLSLSKMTFSHQMIRLLFTEQLYRAQTILKGEPYHHI